MIAIGIELVSRAGALMLPASASASCSALRSQLALVVTSDRELAGLANSKGRMRARVDRNRRFKRFTNRCK